MNLLRILISFCFIGCISCDNSRKETKIKIEIDSIVQTESDYLNQKGENKKYPEVLTYQDIFDKQDEISKSFNDWLNYNSDAKLLKDRKIRDNEDFYNYLTTQFKYMLSSELRILRNEFYARKGYLFQSTDLLQYFKKQTWYKPKYSDLDSIRLSTIEKQIIDSIAVYETKNKDYSENDFQIALRTWFKNNKHYDYDKVCYIDVPSILFRRNIGHLVPGLSSHNPYWFSGEFLSVRVIDTLSKNNLLLGLFGQAMCPAEYCLYAGEIILCDSTLKYIDSHTVEFEYFIKNDSSSDIIKYEFGANNPYEKKVILKINDNCITEDE